MSEGPNYLQELSPAFEPKDLEARLAAAEGGLENLRGLHKSGELPLLHLPEKRDDFYGIEEVAAHLTNNTTDIVILGIGGSSLGAQTLGQVGGYATPVNGLAEGPRVHFFENLDAHTFERALKMLDLRTTRFLVVSKSGGTAEPMMQALAVKAALEEAGGGKYLAQHFAAITEPKDNVLRRFAEGIGCPILEHDPKVGGRYSALTAVGLLPARLMGLDIEAIRRGAAATLAPVLASAPPREVPAAIGAACLVGLAEGEGVNASVLLSYSDRLEKFGLWYRQLWAESLGKDGKGTLPAVGIGPVDQHSQLQLYIAGPADKAYTIFMTQAAGTGPRVTSDDEALGYLSGRTMGDLVDAEQRATAQTLLKHNRPVRIIRLPVLDEAAMGALMMHFMLETIIAAHIMGIDPFDQPAVEEGKILARDYLKEM